MYIDDVDYATDLFTSLLLAKMDKHAPFKRIKCKSNQPKWITGDLLSLIDEKEHLCNIYNRRPTPYNQARKRAAVRRVKQVKQILKKGFIEEALRECHGDSKQTWKVIKTLWPGKKKSIKIKSINGLTDSLDMANALNSHFATAGTSISNKENPDVYYERQWPPDDGRPQMNVITMQSIWELLSKLSPAKACGTDGIPARLIKACGDTILEPLYHIFNLSATSLKFPSAWKVGKITPLYKAGASDSPDNYRPISVLPIFSKLLERLAHNQMYNFVTVSGALSSQQSGFRRGHSTTTCLIEFLDLVYNNIDEGRTAGVLFLDLRKAFVTVDHGL